MAHRKPYYEEDLDLPGDRIVEQKSSIGVHWRNLDAEGRVAGRKRLNQEINRGQDAEKLKNARDDLAVDDDERTRRRGKSVEAQLEEEKEVAAYKRKRPPIYKDQD